MKSKSTTPKKSRKSSNTPKKRTSNKRGAKATPHKSPNRSRSPRTLPKSPITDSMRQTKIQDFFKPSQQDLSQALLSVPGCSTDIQSIPKTTRTKTTKDLPEVKPVFGQQTSRYSLRNTSSKSLRLEPNCVSTEYVINDKNYENSGEKVQQMDCSSNNSVLMSSPNKLNQLMVGLNIDEHQNKINELNSQSSNKDSNLIPVFKRNGPQKQKVYPKENSNQKNYVDKEKQRKLDYFLKNLSRVQRDKDIRSLTSIDELVRQSNDNITEQLVEESDSIMDSVENLDILCDYRKHVSQIVPNSTEDYLQHANISDLSPKVPLSRFLSNILVMEELDDNEIETLFSRTLQCLPDEDNNLIYCQIKTNFQQYLSQLDNDVEISLSRLLNGFYQNLSRISSKITEQANKSVIALERDINCLLTVMEMMSYLLDKCRFKLEVDSDFKLIQLLIIGFALGLDYRLTYSNKTFVVQSFIETLFKHIFIDEQKTVVLFKKLISFCVREGTVDALLPMKILSLFPSEKFLELKRKFAISVFKEFASIPIQEVDLNLNDIIEILEKIQWKILTIEQVYVITQMIAICLEMTDDYHTYKVLLIR